MYVTSNGESHVFSAFEWGSGFGGVCVSKSGRYSSVSVFPLSMKVLPICTLVVVVLPFY